MPWRRGESNPRPGTTGWVFYGRSLRSDLTSGIPHAERERLIERAAVATMRAVALELLDADRAVAIWQEAHARHPGLPDVRLDSSPACVRLAA